MKTFVLRDERIMGDIRSIYLVAPDEEWVQEAFHSTCEYCSEKNINDINDIAQVLIGSHGFSLMEIEGSFSLAGEHPDEKEYYNTLKELGFIN